MISTALWDFANSRPVHSLMFSSHHFFFLSAFSLLSLCLARWFWPDLMNGRHVRTLKFPSLYNGQKVLVWSSCLLDFGTTFLIGNVVFVAVVPDFCGLYSSLRLCCEDLCFISIKEDGCGMGAKSCILEWRNAPVIPN